MTDSLMRRYMETRMVIKAVNNNLESLIKITINLMTSNMKVPNRNNSKIITRIKINRVVVHLHSEMVI
jgi:hypothetical protein